MIYKEKWLYPKTGFISIPKSLLYNQAKLELTSSDLVVLLYLIRFWSGDFSQYPSLHVLSEETGLSLEKIFKILLKLEKHQLMDVEERNGNIYYNLSPLANKLKDLL
jgi:hypothetical protein